MLLEEERSTIVRYGRKLAEKGLTRGTGGNLSIYRRQEGILALSPSGMDYLAITPRDILVMDMEKRVLEGERVASSEYFMHRALYLGREDIDAVIHTHSTFATVLACLHWEIPAVHYLVAHAGLNVRCARYATYGTAELAQNAFQAMRDRKAVLLANHGLLTGGADLETAFNVVEQIEFAAELYYRSRLSGDPAILPQEEMLAMIEKFKTYGQYADA